MLIFISVRRCFLFREGRQSFLPSLSFSFIYFLASWLRFRAFLSVRLILENISPWWARCCASILQPTNLLLVLSSTPYCPTNIFAQSLYIHPLYRPLSLLCCKKNKLRAQKNFSPPFIKYCWLLYFCPLSYVLPLEISLRTLKNPPGWISISHIGKKRGTFLRAGI